jgi:hypothetical protein
MPGTGQRLDVLDGTEPVVGQPRRGEGLGGVLGDVVRDRLDGELLAGAVVVADRSGIGLRSEPQPQGGKVRVILVGAEDQADGSGGLPDGLAE